MLVGGWQTVPVQRKTDGASFVGNVLANGLARRMEVTVECYEVLAEFPKIVDAALKLIDPPLLNEQSIATPGWGTCIFHNLCHPTVWNTLRGKR